MEYSTRRQHRLPLFLALLLTCLLFFACTLSTYALTPSLTLEAPSALVYGDDLTLTATVTGTEITEGDTVTFALSGRDTPLGTATLDANGTATLTVAHPANAGEGKIAYRLDVGTQVITATYSADSSLTDTLTLTVTPRPVTIKDFAVADRIYDGTTAATATHNGPEGVLAGDTVSLVEGSCHFQKQLVVYDEEGNPIPQAVTIGGFALSSTHFYNYELVLPSDVTATILPKDIHILGLTATSRAYDGTTAITLGGGTLNPDDIIADDLSILGLAVITGRLAEPDAGLRTVVLNEIILTGAAAGNYQVVTPTVTVEITPAILSLSVEKVTINKGQSLPVPVAKAEGFVEGESADTLEGFALPTVVPEPINTLNIALTAFAVSYSGGNATANYTFDRETNTAVPLEIRTVTVDSSSYTVSVEDLSIWHNTVITLTPAGDYVGITTDKTDSTATLADIIFSTVLTLDSQGENTVSFALRHSDGTVTEAVTLSYRLDTIAPTGDVLWRGQSIVTVGDPAYRYFSKTAIVLAFTALDGERSSGIKALEFALSKDGPFTAITDDSARVAAEPGLYGVWFRITDHAGNVTVLHTDGLVLYADITTAEPTFSYERLSDLPSSLSLTLNQGTPDTLIYGTETVLTAGEQFTLTEDGALTFGAAYLSTLAAGEHTFSLSFHPFGLDYVENDINDAPTPLTLTLTVTRRAPALQDFSLTPPEGTVYDGTDKAVTVAAPAGMGKILTIHYIDAQGNRLSVAKNAGTYVIKVDLEAGYDYAAATDLIIGELVIDKLIPVAPTVVFEAANGSLSGALEGLVYSINNGAYAPLPADFSGVVQEACTLRLYLPGDGLNTLDSEITVIEITRAAAPVVTPTHESLFATCDGRLLSTTGGIEYRHISETAWLGVTGTEITDLAPGTYAIRVAARGTVLESPFVEATILAAPEFISFTKEVSAADQPAVTVRGDLTALANISLTPLTADPTSASELLALSVIDTRTTEIIGFFDLTLNGRHNGKLTIEIAIGEAYNGKTLTVHRENAAGEIETLSVLCENGILVLETHVLSPILITTPMVTPHGIGSTAWIWVLAVLGGLAVAVCLVLEIRYLRQKSRK